MWIPVWTKQHGSYIMLSASWLIAVLLGHTLNWIHIVMLLFLLAGLNAADLAATIWKRKAIPSPREKLWLGIYIAISVAGMMYSLQETESVRYILPLCLLGGMVFIVLAKLKLQKSISAEWLIFSIIVLSGLSAYEPYNPINFTFIFRLWFLLSLYFGFSIFIVKFRIHEVTPKQILVYLTLSGILFATCFDLGITPYFIFGLMILKTVVVLFKTKWFILLKLKYIGMMETTYTLMMILFFTLTNG